MVLPVAATAVVLAGGRSRRYGSQKLAADVDGEPMLHHVIRIATTVCQEVLVVGAPSGVPVAMPHGLPSTATVVHDADPFEGPLVAMVHAAGSASHVRLLLLAGDMPHLVPALARRVLSWDAGNDGACLVSDGWLQPFPMGLDRRAAIAQGSQLIDAAERSLRSLISTLVLEQITELEWRSIDPEAQSLRDIDRPEDLTA